MIGLLLIALPLAFLVLAAFADRKRCCTTWRVWIRDRSGRRLTITEHCLFDRGHVGLCSYPPGQIEMVKRDPLLLERERLENLATPKG